MKGLPTRRDALRIAAGAAASALLPASAQEPRVAALIVQARASAFVGERIGVVSQALIGAPYVSDPLVGGPHLAERFVLRDDAFDCVTFCETVLAAARSFTVADFPAQLRRIRYRDGEISWRARNHYFADWALNNIANGVCRSLVLSEAAVTRKTVSYMRGLPAERVVLTAIPTASVTAHAERLATGDIVGFLSRRPGIDYFHIGFIVAGRDGEPWLRHAARSKGRVLDERFGHFVARNGVDHVTLLRPQEVWTGEPIV